MLAREHWRAQAEYRAAIDKPPFCYKFFKDSGGFVEPVAPTEADGYAAEYRSFHLAIIVRCYGTDDLLSEAA
jgi:hypothetical protein